MEGKLRRIEDDHCVHSIGVHFVWCTKYRHPVLTDGVDVLVKHTIGQACGANQWICHAIEVMPDHVHAFIQIRHTDAPVNVVALLKSATAVAVFSTFPKLKGQKFWGSGLWSRGCYYGSVGSVSQEAIVKYIDGQKSK